MTLKDIGDLGRAIDDISDGIAKLGANVIDLVVSVFCNIVEKSGGNGNVIKGNLGRDYFCDLVGYKSPCSPFDL